MQVYTVEQMRALEAAADKAGHSYDTMMERAGVGVAEAIEQWLGQSGGEKPRVLVLAGPGNNGGDGLVTARELARRGYSVGAYLWRRAGDDRRTTEARAAGVSLLRASDDADRQTLRRALSRADLVLDALLGTGSDRPAEGELAGILEALRDVRQGSEATEGALAWVHTLPAASGRRPKLVAVDLPSGLQGDGGADPATVAADLTVTFGGPKVGMLRPEAAPLLGQLVVAPIGIPTAVAGEAESVATFLDLQTVRGLLPDRSASAHKGTFGKVMIIGGNTNYVGAPALAAEGAGRSGAGLVTLAIPGTIYPMLAARPDLTSATWLLLPSDMGALRSEATRMLLVGDGDQGPRLQGYEALVLGVGLGQERMTQEFVHRLLGLAAAGPEGSTRSAIGFIRSRQEESSDAVAHPLPPTVVDADALNALAAWEGEWWTPLRERSLVLTPHPAEMARLLKRETDEVQADRLTVAREAAATWGQVVVLKGAYTVIAAPDGRVSVAPFANPVLATAGTGDVLAGSIGAFLAQGLQPFEAASLGVSLHGLAGTLLARSSPVALSSDLPKALTQALAILYGAAAPSQE